LNRRPLARKALFPSEPINLSDAEFARFEGLVRKKYSPTYAPTILTYFRRYSSMLSNVSEIDTLPDTIRNNVIKSLIILSKFLGVHEQFKAALKSYGIKMRRPDALAAFTRIYNNGNSDLDEWLRKVKPIFRAEENLLMRYCKLSGLRKQEAINSFNLIIQLSQQGKLGDYLNSELGILEHFRYRELFIRGTKNCYVSIVPRSLIAEIAESKPVTYAALIKRLQRRNIPCRINQLRDAFGTFLIKHGLVKAEIDLLQGRVGADIFTRHYFSPAIIELRDRTLKALRDMEREGGEGA
jgi:hypothetical protein